MANGYGFGMTMPQGKAYQSPNRRLAELLMQQQAKQPRRGGGNMGQIADFLQSGLGAYLMSRDTGQQQAAQDAFFQGAKGVGGIEGGRAALEGLQDNPYAKNRLQQMLMRQLQKGEEGMTRERDLKAKQDWYKFQQQNKAFPPQRQVPGRDVPFSPGVQTQKIEQQMAGRPSWGPMPGVPGMMMSSTGQLQVTPQTSEQQAQAVAKRELPQVEQQTKDTLANIEALMGHPGLPGVIGVPDSLAGAAYKIFGIAPVGTDEAGFTARLNQIGGQQFLQAFESLKGGGQITVTEGEKATNAMSRLMNTGQSEESYRQAAQELTDIVIRSRDKARTAAGVQPVSGGEGPGTPVRVTTDTEYDALPPGTTFTDPDGKTRRKP